MTETREGTDVVERLENVGCNRQPFTLEHAECICRLTNEGAREITRLRAENEAPRRAIGSALPDWEHVAQTRHAENRALREALKKIASCQSHHPDDVVAIARAALSKALGEGQDSNG